MNSELSDEFEAKLGEVQVFVLSPFLSVVAVCATKLARDGVLSKMLYADV